MHLPSIHTCPSMFHPAGMPLFVRPPLQLRATGRLSTTMVVYAMAIERLALRVWVVAILVTPPMFRFMTAWGIPSTPTGARSRSAHRPLLNMMSPPFMCTVTPKLGTNRSSSMRVLPRPMGTTITLSTPRDIKGVDPSIVSQCVVSLVLAFSHSTESLW